MEPFNWPHWQWMTLPNNQDMASSVSCPTSQQLLKQWIWRVSRYGSHAEYIRSSGKPLLVVDCLISDNPWFHRQMPYLGSLLGQVRLDTLFPL